MKSSPRVIQNYNADEDGHIKVHLDGVQYSDGAYTACTGHAGLEYTLSLYEVTCYKCLLNHITFLNQHERYEREVNYRALDLVLMALESASLEASKRTKSMCKSIDDSNNVSDRVANLLTSTVDLFRSGIKGALVKLIYN